MPQKLKPLKVDTVSHSKAGITVEIFLDRNSNVFYGKLAGQQIEDKACEVVKSKVYEAICASLEVEWLPVIEIEKLMPFHSRTSEGFIGFSLDRYYLAILKSGRIVKSRWLESEEHGDMPRAEHHQSRPGASHDPFSMAESFHWDEERDGKFRLPWPHKGFKVYRGAPSFAERAGEFEEEQTYYVPYSPELWQALNLLQERIEQARQRLDELLLTPDGHSLLTQWMTRLSLPPPIDLLAAPVQPAARQPPTKKRASRRA